MTQKSTDRLLDVCEGNLIYWKRNARLASECSWRAGCYFIESGQRDRRLGSANGPATVSGSDQSRHGSDVRVQLVPGEIRIAQAESIRLASVLRSPEPPAGRLHPLHAYIAMQRGIGTGIADLCAIANFEIEDGPMMGSIDLQIAADLLPDHTYKVAGEVVSLVRKTGSTLGDFDLLTYSERLIDESGQVVATATNTFVLPRPVGPS